jgi:GTPase Era involved in 16S rRNA processing
MLLWNLSLYFLLLFYAFFKPSHSLSSGFSWWKEGFSKRLLRLIGKLPEGNPSVKVLRQGLQHFFREWMFWGAPLYQARLQLYFHSAAIVLVSGTLCGMYFNALRFGYLAGWESTLLEATQVETFLSFLLGPASWVLQYPLPQANALEKIRWISGQVGENAAPWLHLYAVSALLFIVVPRLFLLSFSLFRLWRYRQDFPLPPKNQDFYFQKLFLPKTGGRFWIFPSCLELNEEQKTQQIQLLQQTFTSPQYHFYKKIPYGQEESFLLKLPEYSDPFPDYFILIFALTTTPENETTGILLKGLKALFQKKGVALLIFIEESSFRTQFHKSSFFEQKLQEKRQLWKDFLKSYSCKGLFLFTQNPQYPLWQSEMLSLLWNPEPLEESQEKKEKLLRELQENRIKEPPPSLPKLYTKDPQKTFTLSLISHTNIGKTTLARTLLRQDIGIVKDQAHVTDENTAYSMISTPDGLKLELWDTPGFGDTGRLLERLRRSDSPLKWFLSEVWDKSFDRPFWCSQKALQNIREESDVVLYLVNATEQAEEASYIQLEMELLHWMEKPILVLLNQIGAPRSYEDTQKEIQRWKKALQSFPAVQNVLDLDAFTRFWGQEGLLLLEILKKVTPARQALMEKLFLRWHEQQFSLFQQSLHILTEQLSQTLLDRESLPHASLVSQIQKSVQNALKKVLVPVSPELSPSDTQKPMEQLAKRLKIRIEKTLNTLIQIHGLQGTQEIQKHFDKNHYAFKAPVNEGSATLLGSIVSGILGGLVADISSGGITLGGGMLAGGILGALGAGGLTHAYNQIRGEEQTILRWSLTYFEELILLSHLQYLAIAHFGRGRGDYTESETPQHWETLVKEHLETYQSAIQKIWEEQQDQEAVFHSLKELLQNSLSSILQKLYPALPEWFYHESSTVQTQVAPLRSPLP